MGVIGIYIKIRSPETYDAGQPITKNKTKVIMKTLIVAILAIFTLTACGGASKDVPATDTVSVVVGDTVNVPLPVDTTVVGDTAAAPVKVDSVIN